MRVVKLLHKQCFLENILLACLLDLGSKAVFIIRVASLEVRTS